MKKKVLGRGLDALLPSDQGVQKDYSMLPIEKIVPNESQPRKKFDDASIDELAQSITEKGVIQPLLVRKKDNLFEIIAGERRWRASQKAGMRQIPAIIKEVSDSEALQIGLIENLQREDLNPIEEARAYERLANDFGLTHEEISRRISKNRSTITNQLRLLRLSEPAKTALIDGVISNGHARALLGLESPEQMDEVLEVVVKRKLNVRQTEKLIREIMQGSGTQDTGRDEHDNEADIYLTHIAEELKKTLGTRVRISNKGNRGKIEIDYYSADELERLIGLLGYNR